MTTNDRADAIGGSDVAAILGISPWRTAWDVWAEKTRDPSWAPQDETPQMRWGTLLEPLLLEEYRHQTGRTIGGNQTTFTHAVYPFLRGTVDGIVDAEWSRTAPRGKNGIIEAKTASSAKEWGTIEEPRVPEHYQAQCFFYLALTGAPWCDVAVLLPRGDFRIIRLDADEKVQRGIIAACVAFWEGHVVPRIPPPMDTSQAAARWLARMPDDDEDVLEAGADLEDIIGTLSSVKEAIGKLESSKELLENQAKAIIGEHQKAVGRGWHITYKRNKPFPQTDWKAAAQEMEIALQMAGFPGAANEAKLNNTKMVENRRPFVLKREEDES